MTIATDKDDLTVSATDHPAHHNELAAGVNSLLDGTAAAHVETLEVDGGATFSGTLGVVGLAQFLGSVGIKGPTPWIDVVAYGADATGTNNSTAAIQAAIDAAPTGAWVYGDGTFRLDTGLTINKAIRFGGANRLACVFKPTFNGDVISVNVAQSSKVYHGMLAGFTVGAATDRASGSAVHCGNIGQWMIDDLHITNAYGGRLYRGFHMDESSQCVISHLRVDGCASDGIYLEHIGTPANQMADIWFADGCGSDANLGHGMYVLHTTATTTVGGIYLGRISLYGNGGDGVNLNVGTGAFLNQFFLRGTILDSNTGAGLVTQGAGTISDLALHGVWTSFNGSHGYYLSGVVRNYTIDGGHSVTNNGTGIVVGGADQGLIQNVEIRNNDRSAAGNFGIEVQTGSTFTTIRGNKVYNRADRSEVQDGLNINSGAADTEVTDNYLDTGGATTRYTDAGTRTRAFGNITDSANTAVPVQSNLLALGSVLSNSATAGVGYATGAGGTQSQGTNKTTTVVLNKICGTITMNATGAIASLAAVSFTLTNSAIAATDSVNLNHISGGTAGAYYLNAQPAAGSALITVRNITGGSLTEAPVIQFAVIKAVTS